MSKYFCGLSWLAPCNSRSATEVGVYIGRTITLLLHHTYGIKVPKNAVTTLMACKQ